MIKRMMMLCMVMAMTYAADSLTYKSQIEVTLGTWDLGYTRFVTDRFSLRIKAGWQDDRTGSDLTSDEWYNPESLNPITTSEVTRDLNEQNLTLEMAALVRILETNNVHLVAGAGYRIGRDISATTTHEISTSPYFDNAIITTIQDYDHEMQTTYHGPVGIIQLQYQIQPRLQFFAELNYRLEWHHVQSENIYEEESDYHYYRRTEWDSTDTIQGFEKLKVGLSFQF